MFTFGLRVRILSALRDHIPKSHQAHPMGVVMAKCKYQGCPEQAWQNCPKGFCIFHSPDNAKDESVAKQVWQTFRFMAYDPKEYDFTGWHFPQDPDGKGFKSITFNGPADFQKATFSGDVCFADVTFQSHAGFSYATFQGEANFSKVAFRGDAYFHRIAFHGHAWFSEATFAGPADFVEATFQGCANFVEASFKGKAEFREATLHGNADFIQALFQHDADFDGAIFNGRVNFYAAVFRRAARFSRVHFHESLRCVWTEFNRLVSFEMAAFDEEVVAEELFPWDGASARIDLPSLLHMKSPFFERRPFRRPEQGEALYRLAKECVHRQGNYRMTSKYHLAERCAAEYGNRKKHGCKPWRWGFWRAGVEWLFARHIFGYGERIRGVPITAAFVILWFASFFWAHAAIGSKVSARELATYQPRFWECVYFSVVSFSTLGYGDLVPKEAYRLWASAEALLGAALMALFVVALTRKYMR